LPSLTKPSVGEPSLFSAVYDSPFGTLTTVTTLIICVIPDFYREAVDNCILLGYSAVSSGNFVLIYRVSQEERT
jgi:hypothetical protein